MNKKPIIMSCAPDDVYFAWTVEVQIENFIKLGIDNEVHYLWFTPWDRVKYPKHQGLTYLEEKYKDHKNIKFFYYPDKGTTIINAKMINYIPLLRPWCLKEHFKANSWLSKEAIFYCDADILFTRKLEWGQFMQDNTCYLSYTGRRFGNGNYLDLEYLEGKIEQCKPEMKEQLYQEDVVQKMAECAGITKEIVKANDNGTGGAQYLIKGVDWKFWKDVYDTCMKMRPYMMIINQQYFPGETPQDRENNGFQSFCTDMWAVLYNLWKYGKKTECPKELDFAWGTDPIEKLDEVYIYHNAGITGKKMNLNGEEVVTFFKGAYANNGLVPSEEPEYLQSVSPKYCNYYYAQSLLEVKNPYSKNVIL